MENKNISISGWMTGLLVAGIPLSISFWPVSIFGAGFLLNNFYIGAPVFLVVIFLIFQLDRATVRMSSISQRSFWRGVIAAFLIYIALIFLFNLNCYFDGCSL